MLPLRSIAAVYDASPPSSTPPFAQATSPWGHPLPSTLTPSDVWVDRERNGIEVLNPHLPRSKSVSCGEDVDWLKRIVPFGLAAAFKNHFRVADKWLAPRILPWQNP